MTLPFTHSSIQKTKKNRLTPHVWQVKMFCGSSNILKCSQAFKIIPALSGISPWLVAVRALVSVQTQMSLANLFCPTSNIEISRQLLSVLIPSESSWDLLLPEFLVEQCRRLFRPERAQPSAAAAVVGSLAHEGRYSAAEQHCQVDYYDNKCLNEKNKC